ncbi:MAG: NAD(P)/FAD-dependent oxidoreductase [Verrucomicrobiales bacterium]|nr:NAD(P)/FAD-dependent oxidoreductase [Verrucomicrobiales bacterium]
MKNPKVVILGGGFAGIECAKAFKNKPVDVLLIDRQNHHLFQPLLYQVASAGLAAPEIAHPIRSIFFNQDNVETLMDEVTAFDLAGKKVVTREREIPYDYLVIAMGVKTGYFGHHEWEQHARGLKTLDDATSIRRDILLAFEKAEACTGPEERRRLMTIAVIGGGPTGVELAGTFAELARHVLQRDFKNINTSEAKIYLIEGQDRLLTMYDPTLSDYTRKTLESMGVTVKLRNQVADLRAGEVVLKNETIKAANILWAAGVEAPAISRTLGVETDRAGRLLVETDLSLPGHPEVFVAGDLAHCVDQSGRLVPGLSPAAIQMGRHAAKVILEEINGTRSKDYDVRPQFRYFDKGSMATIGRSHAVAESMGMKFDGIIAWLMWLFIHLFFLVGFRNRLAVLVQWFYAYVRYRRGARIITGLHFPEK